MSSMLWATSEIELALGDQLIQIIGEPTSNILIANVQTDSRKVLKDELFVCLKGDRFDAHDFAEDVVGLGAIGLIAEKPIHQGVICWVVRDTRLALGNLARYWREKFTIPVLAVVGSNGKTTSKEMLASVARENWGEQAVCVTQGNLNNDIGVPLTLFRLRSGHKAAIIEMGMNHPGEISYLAGLVKPNGVLLTNAQREHQEFMKSVAAVAEENGSAFLHLSEGGVAVVPALTEYESIWKDQSKGKKWVAFGENGFVKVSTKSSGAVLEMNDETFEFKPQFVGQHNMANASGVAALANAVGVDSQKIVKGLEKFEPVAGRLKVLRQTAQLTLIDDSYNANPDSVNAASAVLAELPGASILVLGDMGEVGDKADQYHREVGNKAKELGVDSLYLLGQHTQSTAESFGEQAHHFESVEDLVQTLLEQLKDKKYNVLVKGSRFMKMERVVDALLNMQSSPDQGGKHAA